MCRCAKSFSRTRTPLVLSALFCLTLTAGVSTATAQTKTSLEFKVNPPAEQIKLAINQTVGLNFAEPVKRAACANDQVASLTVISPKLVLVTGKTFGFTQMVVWDQKDNQQIYDVRVNVDVDRLQKTINEAAPLARVKVSAILDTVILSGLVPDAPTAVRLTDLAKVFSAKVTNQLRVAGVQQVLLRATIAEVSREAVRALGLNGVFFGADAFGGSNVNSINPTSIGLQERRLLPIDVPNQFQVTGGDLGVGSGSTLYFGLPSAQMELFLQAMDKNSLIRVLAEPNLVAISGQEAQFLAGGELPVPTPTDSGIAITFREYGIRLKFKPVVQAGQIIRLAVDSEVSEPDYTNAVQISGLTIPGLSKRRTQTMVEIGSGQTFAIAGLLSESSRGITNKVPGAGELPIIGALFRSVNYEKGQTELLVLVSPELVSPCHPEQITHIPGSMHNAPNDWQLFGLGLLEGDEKPNNTKAPTTQPVQAPAADARLLGPWGVE